MTLSSAELEQEPENLKKLAGDSETTKNYIRMFFEELTGVYDPDDLDGDFNFKK